ncbi:MAG: DPP IV N-terminal domain-containing protein [Armatimonadota bacterium]|nr:DPP IV N-terminal domain-containing protein [Armatimonadota bacterium]
MSRFLTVSLLRRCMILAAVSVAALSCLSGCTGGGIRVVPTPNNLGKIVFVSGPITQYQSSIFIMNADGSNATRLTSENTQDNNPMLSPDGRHIAFVRNRDIYLMDSDGTHLRQLTFASEAERYRAPHWSPDGTRLVFALLVFGANSGQDIFIMNADGSAIRRVTNRQSPPAVSPVWSPDGNRIAFVSSFTGPPTPSSPLGVVHPAIFVVNIDGSGLLNLTGEQNVPAAPGAPPVNDFGGIAWSPNGARIAFTAGFGGTKYGGSTSDIYSINVDGSNLVLLTRDKVSADPSFSPDGRKIAFARGLPYFGGEIYTMNSDGSEPKPLTNSPALDQKPAWQ